MRGLIAVVAIVAVIGTVVVASRDSHPGVGPDAGSKEGSAVKGGVVQAAPDIVIECENFKTIEDKALDGTVVMSVKKRNEGEEVKYLELPEGWIAKCGLEKDKEIAGKLPGKASYEFQVSKTDTYYLNLRSKWSDTCGNSIFVRVNGGAYLRIEDENGKIGPKNYAWAWHQLLDTGRPKALELKAGLNTLEIHAREDGVWLDQIVIRADANVPTGDAVKAQ